MRTVRRTPSQDHRAETDRDLEQPTADRVSRRQQTLEIRSTCTGPDPHLRRTHQVEETALAILDRLADVLEETICPRALVLPRRVWRGAVAGDHHHGIDVGHDAGIDVDRDIISFLDESIDLPDFDFDWLNV